MLSPDERRQRIDTIRHFPDNLEIAVKGLSMEVLNAHPLAGEWSVQQIVHHLADSHMNAIIRLKLILTAEQPTLVGYDQDQWANLPDVTLPIELSLGILRGLHARWSAVWDSVTEEQWSFTGQHTQNGTVSIEDILITYDNHCIDHLDQIRRVLDAQYTHD
jgi:hypothetical protein